MTPTTSRFAVALFEMNRMLSRYQHYAVFLKVKKLKVVYSFLYGITQFYLPPPDTVEHSSLEPS